MPRNEFDVLDGGAMLLAATRVCAPHSEFCTIV